MSLRNDLINRKPKNSIFTPAYSTLSIGGIFGGIAHNVIADKCHVNWETRPVNKEDGIFLNSEIDKYADGLLLEMKKKYPNASIKKKIREEIVAAGFKKIKDGQKRLLDVDNPLVVPEGTKIKFLITGNDVMHSFFIPSLAVQVYSIAGRINEVWTEIPKGPKTYYGQCNQICGVNHAYMPIVLKSVSKEDYKKWLADAKLKFANVESNIKVVMNNEKVIKENN